MIWISLIKHFSTPWNSRKIKIVTIEFHRILHWIIRPICYELLFIDPHTSKLSAQNSQDIRTAGDSRSSRIEIRRPNAYPNIHQVHHSVKAIRLGLMRVGEWEVGWTWKVVSAVWNSLACLWLACRANRAAATPRFLALN